MLLIASAFAWDQLGATWPAFPVHYEVAADLGGDVDDAEALTAVQAAFDTWSAETCADVTFVYDGRASDTSYGAVDGRNVVFLLDDTWPEEAALVSAPAITTSGADLQEVDIALNGVDWRWATVGADGTSRMDVQAAVTHEVGHMLGLWHSSVTGASLNPAMDGNPEARSLEADDVEGLCTLYATGGGAQGDACETEADCGADMLCLADGGDRYCTVTCDDGACPDGFTCLDAPDGAAVCATTVEGGCGCTTGSGIGPLPAALLLFGLRRRATRR